MAEDSGKVIHLVRCIECKEEFAELDEAVCKNCLPDVLAKDAIVLFSDALDLLEALDQPMIEKYRDPLYALANKLDMILL